MYFKHFRRLLAVAKKIDPKVKTLDLSIFTTSQDGLLLALADQEGEKKEKYVASTKWIRIVFGHVWGIARSRNLETVLCFL